MKGYVEEHLKEIDQILEREPDPAFARRARIIFENLNLRGREKVLEVGCGRGFYLKTLKSVWPDLEVTGVDLNQKYLDEARDFLGGLQVRLVRGDATSLPFKDKTFDRIIASEVLEHIPDDQKALAEMFRVLKSGGVVMVTVPNKNYPFCWDPLNWTLERVFNWHVPANIWWLAGLWADHVRLYSEKELKEKVSTFAKASADKERKGFKIEKTWRATHYCFPFSHFLLYGIGKNLVEKELFSEMNRFSLKHNRSVFQKLWLWQIKKTDNCDEAVHERQTSVNLVLKLVK